MSRPPNTTASAFRDSSSTSSCSRLSRLLHIVTVRDSLPVWFLPHFTHCSPLRTLSRHIPLASSSLATPSASSSRRSSPALTSPCRPLGFSLSPPTLQDHDYHYRHLLRPRARTRRLHPRRLSRCARGVRDPRRDGGPVGGLRRDDAHCMRVVPQYHTRFRLRWEAARAGR